MAFLETTDIFRQTLSRADGLHRLTDDEVKALQDVIYGILKDVTAVCDEHDIPYTLLGGSALGAVRHEGFIPWDDDIDIGVERRYLKRLFHYIKETYGEKYRIDAPLFSSESSGFYSSFCTVQKRGTVFREYLYQKRGRCGIKIDIWILENTFDNRLLRNIHGVACTLGAGLLSCIRMKTQRQEYLRLAGSSAKAKILINVKALLGAPFAPTPHFWFKVVQKTFKMCRNNNSKYTTIPGGRKHFFGELYERSKFMDTVPMKFADSSFSVTKDYDNHFHILYGPGDYMELPPEDKREHHVIYELKF